MELISYTCPSVQQKAIDISNLIMRQRNKDIFKKIMKYLLQSKYLIATTEIRMVAALRKKIYGLMKDYSSIDEKMITQAMAQDQPVDLDKDIDEKYGDDDTFAGVIDSKLEDKLSDSVKRDSDGIPVLSDSDYTHFDD